MPRNITNRLVFGIFGNFSLVTIYYINNFILVKDKFLKVKFRNVLFRTYYSTALVNIINITINKTEKFLLAIVVLQ